MAAPAKQEFSVKDLATTHVILYPSRAHVTRTISNVNLQPGPNQIQIYGITPTADENSVKVDGTGASASVTDMTVDLVPNKESFEDVYGEDSGSDEDSDSDDDTSDDDKESLPAKAKSLEKEIESLEEAVQRANQIVTTAQSSNDYIRSYCGTLSPKHVDASRLKEVLDLYHEQRISTFDTRQKALREQEKLKEHIKTAQKELAQVTKQWKAEQREKKKLAKREKQKRERQKAEKKREAARLRQERLGFWPKKVYRVTVHIDLPNDTPGSSRRSSVSSLATLVKDPGKTIPEPTTASASDQGRSINLLLSYVTSDASWTPRYEIVFSTPTKSGTIIYRAEFRNTTSETWQDTKVSLSTSQASFRGLGDEVPFMNPWHIGLIKATGVSALMSKQEDQHKHQKILFGQQASTVNRAELFGRVSHGPSQPIYPAAASFGASAVSRKRVVAQQQGAAPAAAPVAAPIASGAPRGMGGGFWRSASPGVDEDEQVEYNIMADAAPKPTLEQEDATWEDNGLTQTYELPSTRTLMPSFLTRRHKIASLPFSDLVLTSISVPKLRPAAFLRARFRNPSSSITLLGGTAGLTLDGTFLGNTSLPRVSPGELITLPLGVDPAIQVSYSKPTSKRSTQGIFNKEAAQVYSRNIFITNTKSVPADLLVLDQVPVSADEKLRVEIFQPKGLVQEGDAVPTGVDAKQSKTKNWGRAKATYKKNGEIAWNVMLEKGAACRLAVEYEVRLPANDGVTSL